MGGEGNLGRKGDTVTMRLAIDFDGTLAQWAKYPDIGEEVPLAIETCLALQKAGCELYLWTCRAQWPLRDAVVWCEERGLTFVGVNIREDQRSFSPKMDADYFIDDKGFGAPLIRPPGRRPYLDWQRVRDELLHNRKEAA